MNCRPALRRGGRPADLRVLPAGRRAARPAAPRVGPARPRRAAVHHDPPGLRALVQAAPARADRRREAMFEGTLWWARHLLVRVDTIETVLIQQVGVLETMTPQDFLGVPREALAGERVPERAVPRARVPLRRQGPRLSAAVPRADRCRGAAAAAPAGRAEPLGRLRPRARAAPGCPRPATTT